MRMRYLAVVVIGLLASAVTQAAEPFELKDGDRVVWLGGTTIEREQRYGYWELALTSRLAERNILFRNLGWSGDTVFGQARAVFGTPDDGFKALEQQVNAVKPTVIVVNYGANEAFDGEAGLETFKKGFTKLLGVLEKTKARIVFLTPPPQEDLGRPLPDPAEYNRKLKLYTDALKELTGDRFHHIDMAQPQVKGLPLTDNGVHMAALGYWRTAAAVEAGAGLPPQKWHVEVDVQKKTVTAEGTALTDKGLMADRGLLSFWLLDRSLPLPLPADAPDAARSLETPRVLKVRGLTPGKHTLLIDDKPVATATDKEWAEGVQLRNGPEFEQAEKLRQTIIEKNQLYFHRWRPQNETYLFLFRKGEQGNNAREVPLFDPLAAEQEREIARLRVPLPHLYEFLADRPLAGVPNPDPEEERKSFIVADGFDVTLFAADPLLAKPIQMNFDAKGRLWVASSETYPQIKPGQKANDKVIVLEDTRGVGKADRISVFADGLLIPTGLEPGDGGVYVANSTELLHLTDTDGDGKADKTRVVLSGFGTEDTHHILHTLRWGHDGMLYFNQSIYIHSHVETPHGVRRLGGGGIWQFRPETMRLEVFARGWINSWGHHFDRWGQSFVTDGAGGEGINYAVPEASYPTIGGSEPTLHGLNPGSPKYCGLEVVSGRHFPDDWQGNLITNDFRAHRVCRFVLKEDGSGYSAKLMPDLIKTNHAGFRPIDVKMGPDGALYIADWYNPIINHGEVDFRDPRRDKTHGRIWRVTAKNRPLVERPKLVEATNAELLESLKAPEDWTRHQAKRVLKERGAEKVLPDLKKWVENLKADETHHLLEGLWVYQSLDTPEPNLVRTLLRSGDHHARAAAVRVLDQWRERVPDGLNLLAAAVADEHPQVRLEAVCALRHVAQPRAVELAMTALDRPVDKFLDYALGQTARELGPVWLPLVQKGELTFGGNARHLVFALQAVKSPQTVQTLVSLVKAGKVAKEQEEAILGLIAGLGGAAELSLVFERALESEPARQATLLTALDRAARERKAKPTGDLARLTSVLKSDNDAVRSAAARLAGVWGLDARPQLAEMFKAKETSDAARQAAADGLVMLGGKETREFFADQVAHGATPRIKIQAVMGLSSLDADEAARKAVDLLRGLPAGEDPSDLFAAFAQLKTGPASLTKALAGQKIPEDVAKIGIRSARAGGRDVSDLVAALTTAGGLQTGAKTLSADELKQMMADVAKLGDPARGEAVYRRKDQTCMKCHAIAGAGGQVGPGLESLGASAPVDYIIESLLTPNKAVKEGFQAVTVTTTEGKLYTGLKVRETKSELVLRTSEDRELTLRPDVIDETKPAPSLMPEGLTDTLTRQELLDLVRFLSELGKVGPFAVGKEQVVRTWQVLEPTPAAMRLLQGGGVAAVAGDSGLSWTSAYSTVAGVLPAEAVTAVESEGKSMAFVRCKLDVTTAGKVRLKLNGEAGLTAWLDGSPAEAKDEMILDLPAGQHTLTFAVDPKQRREGLRCELEEVAGSPARARVVGGK